MRIDFHVDGGFAVFPGLAAPVTIDAATLTRAQATHWRALVQRAGFFSIAAPPAACAGADRRAYTIAVEDAGRSRTLTFGDPVAEPALRDLVDALRAHVSSARP